MNRTVAALASVVGAASVALVANLPAVASMPVSLPKTYPGALTAAQVSALAKNATDRVIIVLRDQHHGLPAVGARATAARQAALSADQSGIVSELRRLRAPALHPYRLVNMVSATVSADEATRLAANPAVAAVLPDAAVPKPVTDAGATSVPAGPAASAAANTAAAVAAGVCPSDPTVPLLEPEALQLMHVENQPGNTQPAAHDLVDGTGVKVGYVADGVDIHNPDFQRGGHSIFYAYRDFSGDGVNGVNNGAESFGDSSAIAAQGHQTYNLSTYVNPAHPLPPGCNIRIKGVAPGASLAAEKAFGNSNIAFNSSILQAMEAAVLDDHVDVLNESFGGNPYPDKNMADLTSLFDEQAVAMGVTVVSSTGDAGITNTLGSPGTDPAVIAAGATTQLRAYAQTGSYAYNLGKGGWISNNISALSSGGVAQLTPRTLDIVAPGDLGWALCSPLPTFTGCTDPYNGNSPSSIQLFGGTSQSSPLTAGTAALVIQAYRQAHGGASPTPAMVKKIITSSATDLGAPATEQGSGLVNALAAVRLAKSVPAPGSSALPATLSQGNSLLISPPAIAVTGEPGSSQTVPVTVTNTGAQSQTVHVSLRSLGEPQTVVDTTVRLSPRDPGFVDSFGRPSRYTKVAVHVPAGTARLDGVISYFGLADGGTGRARMTLFDPEGRVAAYTLNQGPGGFGQIDVRQPEEGTWTAVVWMIDLPGLRYTGPVHVTFTGQAFEYGSVSPDGAELAPGQSRTFAVRVVTPAAPGDASSSVVVSGAEDGMAHSVPVVSRSLIPLESGGRFSGILTGGNGRMGTGGQLLTYQFDVAPNAPDMSIGVRTGNLGYQLFGVLIGPDGMAADYGSTVTIDYSKNPPVPVNTTAMQLFRRTPAPGRWAFDVLLNLPITSLQTSHPFHGKIDLGAVAVTGTNLPSGATLAKGKPITAAVTVHNNGVEPEAFFVDPRLNTMSTVAIQSLFPTSFTLPLTTSSTIAQFLVPPDTNRLDVAVQGSVPVATDTSPAVGDPDVITKPTATGAVATVSATELTPTVWSCAPVEIGPFGPKGAPKATATCSATAHTATFDPAVMSSTGDAWLASVSAPPPPFSPLVLQPGQSGTIKVTITPSATSGSTVSGFLGVDTWNPLFPTSDQLVNLPYSYTVG